MSVLIGLKHASSMLNMGIAESLKLINSNIIFKLSSFLAEAAGDGATDTKIIVQASSGVAAAWGIHHYLKYYAGAHFSWDTTRTCNLIFWTII